MRRKKAYKRNTGQRKAHISWTVFQNQNIKYSICVSMYDKDVENIYENKYE